MNIIFCFSVSWLYLKERHHHIVNQLKDVADEIVVVCSPPAYFERFKYPPWRIKREGNIKIIALNWLLPHRGIFAGLAEWMNSAFLLSNLDKDKDYVFVGTDLKFNLEMIRRDKRIQKIIYDCVDIVEGFNQRLAKFYRAKEDGFIDHADKIIVSSRYLENKIKTYNKPVYYISNGVDYDYFEKVRDEVENETIKDRVRKNFAVIYGYAGGIGDWFDFEAVRKLLDKDSDSRVVILGMIMDSFAADMIKQLRRSYRDRFAFLGFVNGEEVPKYIKYFNYGLLPFKLDHPVVKGVNPLKLYEYFAMGKIVVGNVWEELSQYEKMGLFQDIDSFSARHVRDENLAVSAVDIARNHDWRCLARQFMDVIKE